MSDMAQLSADLEQKRDGPMCRACLRRCERANTYCDIFQAWSPAWAGMEATIAEDLAKIANIEVTASDLYPKSICHRCYEVLLEAATFAEKVRYCNTILVERCKNFTEIMKTENEIENNWPKPIQIDKNINGSVFVRTMEVDIKQEVLSDEEYSNESMEYNIESAAGLDIKVEPEEIEEHPPMQITINGTMSLNPNTNNPVINGIAKHGEQHLEVVVKQEPVSDEEDNEVIHDLPLECMLCAKSFHKIAGLKAHVIAEHSYKGVKRKSVSRTSPEKKQKNAHKYICQICKRGFTTSTDLLVHETCHNMFTCYCCYVMFDSFDKLTKHRKSKCKASPGLEVQRPKMLDDVLRPKLKNIKDSSPTLDTGPVPQTNPVSNINAISDTNLVSDTNTVSQTNLESATKPVTDTNLVSQTNLISDKKPISGIEQGVHINSVSDADLVSEIVPSSVTTQVSETKPESKTKLTESRTKSVSETNSVLDSITVSATNSINTHPILDTSPVSETNPVDTHPVSDTNAMSDTNQVDINPVLDTNPVSDTNPVDTHTASDTSPVSDTNPVDTTISDTSPVIDTNPVDTCPVSYTTLVSDTNPVDTTPVPVDTPVSATNLAKDVNKVISDSTIGECDDDTSDSSMKLHLAIHSANQETEPMDQCDVDLVNNSNLQVDSLCEDDK